MVLPILAPTTHAARKEWTATHLAFAVEEEEEVIGKGDRIHNIFLDGTGEGEFESVLWRQ